VVVALDVVVARAAFAAATCRCTSLASDGTSAPEVRARLKKPINPGDAFA
jgi:hypothetical protein